MPECKVTLGCEYLVPMKEIQNTSLVIFLFMPLRVAQAVFALGSTGPESGEFQRGAAQREKVSLGSVSVLSTSKLKIQATSDETQYVLLQGRLLSQTAQMPRRPGEWSPCRNAWSLLITRFRKPRICLHCRLQRISLQSEEPDVLVFSWNINSLFIKNKIKHIQ